MQGGANPIDLSRKGVGGEVKTFQVFIKQYKKCIDQIYSIVKDDVFII